MTEQWDRLSLGGVEIPACKTRQEIRDAIDRVRRFTFVFPMTYTIELVIPAGDDLERWEDEGGAL